MTTTVSPVAWFEIGATDTAKAEAFYGSLFGWEFSDGPTGPVYRMAEAGEGPCGGITTAEKGLPASYAIFSVQVPDVAATCERLAELGGRVLVGPAEVPGVGLVYANVEDPDGNHFGLFTPPAG
jgi:predicted enzyme related to lactoylglutathione lyase